MEIWPREVDQETGTINPHACAAKLAYNGSDVSKACPQGEMQVLQARYHGNFTWREQRPPVDD